MLHPVADVAIVGAGPAGAWAAYRLARAGARVVVFDGSHPREKPCGGGLTGRALALVREAIHPGPLHCVAIDSAAFELDATRAAVVDLHRDPRSPALAVASRRALDGTLLDAAVRAGAHLVAERVVDVVLERSAARVVTRRATWPVPIVLGADGATSLVRRRAARQFTRRQLSIASGFFAFGTTDRQIRIGFESGLAGYLWAFPRSDHLALGACAPATETSPSALRALVADWMRRDGTVRATRVEEYSWPIPTLRPEDFDEEHPAGDRWMLLGDAAGLVDPITREGIFFALRSAELAAAALAGDGDAPRRYVAALADEVYPELQRAARMAAGFFRSPFLALLLEALGESPSIRSVMADLIAGRQPYRSLRRRLLGTGAWRLAWRLLKLEVSGAFGAFRRRAQEATRSHRGAPAARDAGVK